MFQKTCLKVLSFSCLLIAHAHAQQKAMLESLIPPAPNAAELGKYGSYPVGTLTGVPDISFPLYEINTGKLKLPVTLSYHASGIKVNQRSTDVGLGWSIMAGGTISRSIFDSPDDRGDSYFNNSYTPPTYQELQNIHDFTTLQTYTYKPGHDLEPDLFVYTINGQSGKFIGKKDKSFLTIPFDPIKIQRGIDGQGKLIFQITGDNGTIYQFNNYTSSFSETGTNTTPINRQNLTSWYLTRMIAPDYTDTISFEYEINAVQDAYETHSYPIGQKPNTTTAILDFFYGPLETINTTVNYGELLVKKITFRNGSIQFNRNTNREDTHLPSRSLDEMIVYNKNNQPVKKFTFNHDYFRANPNYGTWQHSRLKLTGIVESDINNTTNKPYSFDYNTTPLPPSGSYNLDYWGFYNGQNNLSLIPTTTIYANELNSVYFNDGLGYGVGLDPSNSWVIGNANREPSAQYMQASVLNKIVYPTGGYAAFDYEPHKYLSAEYTPQSVTKGGITTGIDRYTKSENTYSFSYPTSPAFNNMNAAINANLVINFSVTNMNNSIVEDPQTVTITDLTTSVTQTWKHTGDLAVAQTLNIKYLFWPTHSYVLKVTDYGDPSTFINCTLSWSEFTDQHPVRIGGGLRVKSIRNYNNDGNLAKEENYVYGNSEDGLGTKLFDERSFYRNFEDNVLEYFIPSSDRHDGNPVACVSPSGLTALLRRYIGFSTYSSINYQGSPVLYPFVTKYEGNASTNIGKTTYKYNINLTQTAVPNEFVNGGNYGAIDAAWYQGELAEEIAYKNESNQYTPVTKAAYEYTSYNEAQEFAVQLKQYKQAIILGDCVIPSMDDYTQGGRPGLAHFTMFQYPIPSGARRETKETRTSYAQVGGTTLQTITTTQYLNPGHLYPSVTNTMLSDGAQKTIKYYYPPDLSTTNPDNIYKKLTDRNILNIPVRTENYIDNQILESDQLFFNNNFTTNANQIWVSSQSLYDKSNAAIKSLNFQKYDQYGNSLEKEMDGNVMANLFDYNSIYPVCEVKNATNADIAYTSFEADGSGNWSIGNSSRTAGGITGTGCYQLGDGDITRYGLTAGTTYFVSYWTQNGNAFTITGTQGTPFKGRTINGWTYFEHRVTGVSQVLLSQTTPGFIDELRLYPSYAQMSTYTYAPLIGMTSGCSANNIITYYEYDLLDRLQVIKDMDGNVIKTIDYHYKGQ
jgi:hypothetical protein